MIQMFEMCLISRNTYKKREEAATPYDRAPGLSHGISTEDKLGEVMTPAVAP